MALHSSKDDILKYFTNPCTIVMLFISKTKTNKIINKTKTNWINWDQMLEVPEIPESIQQN